MITKLTQEETEKLDIYQRDWHEIGLSAGSTNYRRAEACVDEAYLQVNLQPPKIKIWTHSPFHAIKSISYIKDDFIVGKNKSGEIRTNLIQTVADRVSLEVSKNIIEILNKNFDYIFKCVHTKSIAHIWNNININLNVGKNETINYCCYGNQDSYWLAIYDFIYEVMGLECVSPLTPLIELASHCHWWWPFEDIVILTEKPNEVTKYLKSPGEIDIVTIYNDGWSVV